jgi:Cu/Ag efflux pump CusA
MLGHGAGAEMRVSLGTAVFCGMIGVTIFGIFLTPVFYYLIMYRQARRDSAMAQHVPATNLPGARTNLQP